MHWILYDQGQFHIHQALAGGDTQEMFIEGMVIRENDLVYFFTDDPQKAVRYVCRIISARPVKQDGIPGIRAALKCEARFPEPGVTLSDLETYEIGMNELVSGPVYVPEALQQLFSYWEIGAFPRKEKNRVV